MDTLQMLNFVFEYIQYLYKFYIHNKVPKILLGYRYFVKFFLFLFLGFQLLKLIH